MTKIHDAFKAGQNGEPAPDRTGRVKRMAHHLGTRSAARTVELNEPLHERNRARFEMALSQAKGVNKQALQIILAAAPIPSQAATHPLAGNGLIKEDGSEYHQWNTLLTVGKDRDTSLPDKTPLLSSLGTLHIDNLDGSLNAVNLTIDNLVVTTTVPDNYGGIGEASTTFSMNSRPYEFASDEIKVDSAEPFVPGVKIVTDGDGNITYFGMKTQEQDRTGYVDEKNPAAVQVDLAAFLDSAQAAAEQTAQAYQAVGSLTEPN